MGPRFYLPGTSAALDAGNFGGKAAGLARLAALGGPTPPWFALSVEAVAHTLSFPDQGHELIAHAVRTADGGALAVRSSAIGEDGDSASFAGQFESVLSVQPEQVCAAVRHVAASADSPHALAYSRRAGRPFPAIAVVIQQMVDAAASGVAFTADPVSGDRSVVVISATAGIGEALVRGEVEGETWHVAEGGEPARKDRSDSPSLLQPGEVTELAALVGGLATKAGVPHDFEWALTRSGVFLLLQMRPLTALAPDPSAGDTGGERRVWDNSNIIESYPGVTLPLTFTFARRVYEEAYVQFCEAVGVEPEVIAAHRPYFAHMLGHVRGRIYYNLLNWYRILSLLPGYSVNRAFMERMMGVRQKLADPPDPPYQPGRLHDALRLAGMLGRLAEWDRRLPREVSRFHAHVDAVLAAAGAAPPETLAPDALAALFRRLEQELLGRWQAPLVNDFFTMIWHGILARAIERQLPDASPDLIPSLLSGQEGQVSAEPARRAAGMARWLRDRPLLAGRCRTHGITALLADPELAPLRTDWDEFLTQFGDRCPGELKLETEAARLGPELLAAALETELERATDPPDRTAARREAEVWVRSRLSGLRRRVFFSILRRARERGRDRENMRLERTRVFGMTRRIFVQFGQDLYRRGMLDQPREIFFLTVEEVLGWVEGSVTSQALRDAAHLRRLEYDTYRTEPPPPDRIETFGPPDVAAPRPATGTPGGAAGSALTGMPCSAGRVRGIARVLQEPDRATDLRGCILVADRTDPGWTLLFPGCAGLLVQRGNLLSHSAIVARELGLPCIVGIRDLLAHVRDGDEVMMDGAAGTVEVLCAAPPTP